MSLREQVFGDHDDAYKSSNPADDALRDTVRELTIEHEKALWDDGKIDTNQMNSGVRYPHNDGTTVKKHIPKKNKKPIGAGDVVVAFLLIVVVAFLFL